MHSQFTSEWTTSSRLIFDETKLNVIGFKLKGFKHVFDTHVRPHLTADCEFVDLVRLIEECWTEVGTSLFVDPDYRNRAYKAVRKIAANDNVKITAEEVLPKAA